MYGQVKNGPTLVASLSLGSEPKAFCPAPLSFQQYLGWLFVLKIAFEELESQPLKSGFWFPMACVLG